MTADPCIHHGEAPYPNCPFCVVVKQREEIKTLNAKIDKFYHWFRIPPGKVDEMLEKIP